MWDIFERLFNRSLVAIMLRQFLFDETAANVTLLLIPAHVAGGILASWQHRENLVKAMFTGREKAD
jgi:cytochrome b